MACQIDMVGLKNMGIVAKAIHLTNDFFRTWQSACGAYLSVSYFTEVSDVQDESVLLIWQPCTRSGIIHYVAWFVQPVPIQQ